MSNAIANGDSAGAAIEKPNQFPWKLYDMLDRAEERNEEHIISWIRNGQAFKVHNRDLFIEEYMKKMFNQTKFKSFQRQLNLWGFERIQSGPDKGSYFHPLFMKGRRECCRSLTRVRLKGPCTVPLSGIVEKGESQYSPQSVATPDTLPTAGAAKLPLSSAPPPTLGGSNSLGNVSPPTPSLRTPIDVSQPAVDASSSTIVDRSFRGALHPTQLSEFLHCHTSQRRREMIRNAAIGLSPDFSMTLGSSPSFPTTAESSFSASKDHAECHTAQQHLDEYKLAAEPSRPHLELSMHELQQQEQSRLMQKQQQSKQGYALKGQRTEAETHEILPRRRSTSRGLEALLSVSAQRRLEEEVALSRDLSDHGEMAQMS